MLSTWTGKELCPLVKSSDAFATSVDQDQGPCL